jgi:vitamin-K-epoxide reductase (warfarin-sensitive)
MRYVLVMLAIAGVVVSAFALREHYRTDTSPCSINEKWDCGIVNHSPYAVIWKVPVAIIGIAGYLLMAVMSFRRAYPLLLATASMGLGFSLYLAHIEAHVLGVWCVYCVASLAVISLMSVLVLATLIVRLVLRRGRAAAL